MDKFGPNIWGKTLSLLKSREFCHLFQQVIDSLIFILHFWSNIALSLVNVFRWKHTKMKATGKETISFPVPQFYYFVQSFFCTLILFSTRFLFYASYRMDIWGKLMPFHTRFVVSDTVRNLDIDFLVFLDSFVGFILFLPINGVSLTMPNSCLKWLLSFPWETS